MASTETFDPALAGFRVASTPITRKPRTPSSKPVPRPQYADAVWYSFTHDHPLEVEVPVRAAEDTIRKLKQAARYLERTESTASKKVEVRVQISVEPLLEDGQPVKPAKSVVKFLGHRPWELGRRVSKLAAEQAAAEPAPEVPAPRPEPARKHRRTVAGTREGAHRRRSALRGALVGSVITRQQPSFPVFTPVRGLLCFPLVFPMLLRVIAT